jgi:hypothetical protein
MSQDLKIRLGGLLSIAIGLGIAWFTLWMPLQQARAGAAEISMHIKAAYVLVPFALVFGTAFLAGGTRAQYRDVTHQPPKLTPLGWMLMAATLVLAGLCFWYVQGQFAALGYR